MSRFHATNGECPNGCSGDPATTGRCETCGYTDSSIMRLSLAEAARDVLAVRDLEREGEASTEDLLDALADLERALARHDRARMGVTP